MSRYTDVTLLAGGRAFSANKSILSVRSPVFERMFFIDNLHENHQEKNIIIKVDLEPKILEALLNYIYTTDVPNLSQLAIDLLFVAQKYDLVSLYNACIDSMVGNLTFSNAIKMLIFADKHQLEKLKKNSISFINQNGKRIFESEDWTKLLKPNPDLIVALYESFIEAHFSLSNEQMGFDFYTSTYLFQNHLKLHKLSY